MKLKVFDEQSLCAFDRDTHRTGQRHDHRDKSAQTLDGMRDSAAEQLLAGVVENTQVMETSTPVDAAPNLPCKPLGLS
jgi:hypothetical protein